jgi:prepilin-type processing-associated H-X9-DG protein
MQRAIGVGVLIVLGLILAGVLVTWLAKSRVTADRATCANNLRELTQFAGDFADPKRKHKDTVAPQLVAVPAGTIMNPALPHDRRLSWVVDMLPRMNQRRQPAAEYGPLVDPKRAWDEGTNLELSRKKLVSLLCPGNPAEGPDGQPWPTQYPGIGGVGIDAATLSLGPPIPARAGCFRYDAPTPLELIASHDGLSQTMMIGEISLDSGPWLRGGPATVRGLDDRPGAPSFIGVGGQFGGNHPEGANFAAADGSVRLLTPRVNPDVLKALLTIAGGPVPLTNDE